MVPRPYLELTVHWFVSDPRSPAGRSLRERWEAAGHRVSFTGPEESLDSSSAAADLLDRVTHGAPPLDGVVYTEDYFVPAALADRDEDNFDAHFSRLADRAFVLLKVFGKHLMEQKRGSVVVVSSLHAEKPTGVNFAYSTALGAVGMLCKEASVELGRSNVRINVIQLGGASFEEGRYGNSPLNFYAHFPYSVPRGVPVSPEELAGAVEFLLSPSSEGINGTEITLDGGLNRGYFQLKSALRKLKESKDPLWDRYEELFGEREI